MTDVANAQTDDDLFSPPDFAPYEHHLPSQFDRLSLDRDFCKQLPSTLPELERKGLAVLSDSYPELIHKFKQHENQLQLPANLASIVLPTNISSLSIDDKIDAKLFWTKVLDEDNTKSQVFGINCHRRNTMRPRGGTIIDDDVKNKLLAFKSSRKKVKNPKTEVKKSQPLKTQVEPEEGYSLRNPPKRPGISSLRNLKIIENCEAYDTHYNIKHYNHAHANEMEQKRQAQQQKYEQIRYKSYEELYKKTGSYMRPRERYFPGGEFIKVCEPTYVFIDSAAFSDIDDEDTFIQI